MSVKKCQNQLRSEMRRGLSGSKKNKDEHLGRGMQIAEAIYQKYTLYPRDWRFKHYRWYLDNAIRDKSDGTRYHHYRTVREIVEILTDKWDQWKPRLHGSWVRPSGDGSQPIKATGRRRR